MKYFYFIIFIPLFFTGCAQKQSLDPQIIARVNLLEERIFSLEKQRSRAIADLRDRTDSFRERVDKELKNFQKSQRFFITELDQLKTDISLITNDNEIAQNRSRKNKLRITQIIRKLGNQIIALNELKIFFNENVNLNDNDGSKDAIAYNTAFKLYRKKRFADAIGEFKVFQQQFPDSILVDDAIYLTAYMFFLKGDYDQSALKFHEMIEQYQTSNKINDAKWWLGVSFERTGDINAAMDIYKNLLELPPENPIRVKAELRLEEVLPGNSRTQ